MSNNEILLERLDILTRAIQHFAQVEGKRLNKTQLGKHLSLHRNTVRRVVAAPGFPRPDAQGRWSLDEVIAWEVADRKH